MTIVTENKLDTTNTRALHCDLLPNGSGRAEITLEDGRHVTVKNRCPLFTMARRLIELGLHPETLIVFWRGKLQVTKPQTIGHLAKWTIEEGPNTPMRFRRYRPHPEAGTVDHRECEGASPGQYSRTTSEQYCESPSQAVSARQPRRSRG